jgi:Mrp family chromosome partitioning ATPase
MSIIERSLQKMASGGRAAAAASPRAQQPTGRSPQRVAEAPVTEPARQFQAAQLDPVELERNRVIAGVNDSSSSSAYKILRTRLLQRLGTNNWNSVGVTGTVSGEGKSLTAINLAITLARDVNTSVFLVDLDLQRPSVASQLGMPFNKGLSDFLLGNASFEDIVYSPGIDRLAIIPNSRGIAQASELFGSARMDELVGHLQAEQPRRVIVYDLPPLLMSDDVLSFAPRADGLLLVVSQGMTERKTLESAGEVLADMNLIGVVLNRSTEHDDQGYGYY